MFVAASKTQTCQTKEGMYRAIGPKGRGGTPYEAELRVHSWSRPYGPCGHVLGSLLKSGRSALDYAKNAHLLEMALAMHECKAMTSRVALARILGLLMVLLPIGGAGAQQPEQGMNPQGMGMCQCPMSGMHGATGPIWMVLGGLLTVAAIAALVALSVFLIRRSGPRAPTAA